MTVPLTYFNTTSLDGYIADADGRFDWGEPDHEVHSFVNELVGPARLHLYGRRNYEIMTSWEDMSLDGLPPASAIRPRLAADRQSGLLDDPHHGDAESHRAALGIRRRRGAALEG